MTRIFLTLILISMLDSCHENTVSESSGKEYFKENCRACHDFRKGSTNFITVYEMADFGDSLLFIKLNSIQKNNFHMYIMKDSVFSEPDIQNVHQYILNNFSSDSTLRY